MPFAIWSLALAFHDLVSLNTVSSLRTGHQKVSYLFIFVIQENEIIISMIHDTLFFPLVNRARDPLYDPHNRGILL